MLEYVLPNYEFGLFLEPINEIWIYCQNQCGTACNLLWQMKI